MYSFLRLSDLFPLPSALCLLPFARRPPPGISKKPKIRLSRYARDWHLKTAPLNVSYTRQYRIVISVSLLVNVYTQQPRFSHAFSPVKDVSLAQPKRIPLCTHLAYLEVVGRDWHSEAHSVLVMLGKISLHLQ